MATQFARPLKDLIGDRAYRVELVHGQPQWWERRNGEQARFDAEPNAGLWRRVAVRLRSLLTSEGRP